MRLGEKSSPQNDAKYISDNHDHIVVFAKNKDTWHPKKLDRTAVQNSIYKHSDEFDGIDKDGKNYGRGAWFPSDMTVKTISDKALYPIVTPSGRTVYPAKGRSWVYFEEKFNELVSDNRITFGKNGNNKPCIKRFLSEIEDKGIVAKSIWQYKEVEENRNARQEVKKFNEENPFATPKPEKLLQRILTLATNENDLVLDSFLGSGTTAAVAHKMNRRWIGIEMGEHAKTHCAARLQKVIDGEQGGISKAVDWQGGGGFRFYHLGKTIFDKDGCINKNIKFEHLAAHIWFSETKTPITDKDKSPLIGIYNKTAYYLLYNGILGDKSVSGGNVLTTKTLDALPKYNGKKVVYGETTRLSSLRLDKNQITFKQTPYDIKAR